MWKWNDLSSSLVADFSGTNTTTCSTSPVVFADLTTGGTPTTWLWSFPGGTPTTSILPNPSVTYSAPGTYDVTLTVGDGNSQTTYTQTAFVTSIAPATVPSAITGALALCETDVETYAVTNDPNVVYNWTIPASWTGTSTTNSITVTAGATGGNVEVNAENICGMSANSSVAVVIGVGSPTAGFTQSNVVYDYTFTSSSTNAGTWSWDFGDGIGTSNLENPTYTYTTNGTFTVTLIVDNGCGTDTYTENVTITGVGLDEHNLNLISVYPNPAENLLNVLVSQDMIGESYEVKDVSGKVIYTGMITQELTTIELNTISSGIYFVSVGETSSAQKFVKE
jgi:PKD repeat protein